MKILLSDEDFIKLKSQEKVPLECTVCGKTFYRMKAKVLGKIRGTIPKVKCTCCSYYCYRLSGRVKCLCANCGLSFEKQKSQMKGKNNFCSKSCAAFYNNTHKTYGTRRSKLEIYIESCIRESFPKINLLVNDKTLINSELDFYFPDLKFAVELNGIFHYEPIFGIDKHTKIQNNDKQKIIRCYEKDVELCVIDTSGFKHFKKEKADFYKNIIFEILINKI